MAPWQRTWGSCRRTSASLSNASSSSPIPFARPHCRYFSRRATSASRVATSKVETGSHGRPRGGVLLPHAVGDLGAPREDLPVHRVQVERSMDHTRVPASRVRGDVNLLLEDRDLSLVSIREPICD